MQNGLVEERALARTRCIRKVPGRHNDLSSVRALAYRTTSGWDPACRMTAVRWALARRTASENRGPWPTLLKAATRAPLVALMGKIGQPPNGVHPMPLSQHVEATIPRQSSEILQTTLGARAPGRRQKIFEVRHHMPSIPRRTECPGIESFEAQVPR